MATVTTTSTKMSRTLSRISTFRERNPWPEPELSIGELWCRLGKNHCWEVVGPARDIINQILERIRELLESRQEYLNEGVHVRCSLRFDSYMIGRTPDQARPTIMFSSENKTQRQRAMKIVRESQVLQDHPGIRLGDSSRPPRLSREPRLLRDEDSSEDITMVDAQVPQSDPSQLVYYWSPLDSIYGIPIIIKNSDDVPSRESTMGVICVGNEYFGLTVQHVFTGEIADGVSSHLDEIEFYLEDEDQFDDAATDFSFMETMSRASASPQINAQSESSSMSSQDLSSLHLLFTSPVTGTLLTHPLPNLYKTSKAEENVKCLKLLGSIKNISQSTKSGNLDWALVQIECPEFLSFLRELSGMSGHQTIDRVVETLPGPLAVQIMMSTPGMTTGTISGCPTYTQSPNSSVFQEMWVVQLDGPLRPGDSGSWVVDPVDGSLYGYITSGDPGTSIAYIVPAYQTFHEIRQVTGESVTLQPLVYDSSASEDEYPPALEEASDMPWESSFWTKEGSRNKAMSSRPTTPSERSYEPLFRFTRHEQSPFLARSEVIARRGTDKPESHTSIAPENTGPPIADNMSVVYFGDNDRSLEPGSSLDIWKLIQPERVEHDHEHLFYSSIKQTKPPKGRQRRLTLQEKQEALVVRKAKACWACHLSKIKCSPCSPGSPCQQCERLAGKRRFCRLACFNDPLESLQTFFFPDILSSRFTRSQVESFISQNFVSWGTREIPIKMSWGIGSPIAFETVALTPRESSSEKLHALTRYDSLARSTQIQQGVAPLGIPLADIELLTDSVRVYVQGIVQHDLVDYVEVVYDSGPKETLEQQLLKIICTFYSSSLRRGREQPLLSAALEIHLMSSFLDRSLILTRKSMELVNRILERGMEYKRCSPIVAQAQIKLVMYELLRNCVSKVLEEWGKKMWISNKTAPPHELWVEEFCVLAILVLVMDSTMHTAHLHYQSAIAQQDDAVAQHAKLTELQRLTERELFDRCKEIFHTKFKTRKSGKESMNPIRDGMKALKISSKEQTPQETMMLMANLHRLAKICGSRELDVSTTWENDEEGPDLGRMTRIFLADFGVGGRD